MERARRLRALDVVAWLVCAVAVARAAGEADVRPAAEPSAVTETTTETTTTTEPGEPASGAGAATTPAGGGETRLEELVVEARKPMTAASAEEIRARDYAVRPHQTVMQILNNLPGLVVAQHQGGSKAPQWFLRGFDADHGTDVAVSVDELPINLPTHAHGQGYADPNFLIPEVVDRVQLYKGPYFTQLGDFATAGAVDFVTRDRFDENFFLAEGGSFDTMRYVLGGSQDLGPVKTIVAAQAYTTNGPFENPENLWRYNGFAKMSLDPTPQSHLSLTTMGYQANWDGSGQIPLRLVSEGKLDRFGSLDPTEGGHTDREVIDLHWRYTPSSSDTWEVQTYGTRYKLRLNSDFTFYANTGLRFFQLANGAVIDTRGDGRPLPSGAHYIPGDGLAQDDSRTYWGAKARWTRNWFFEGVPLQSQLAVETRNDDVHVSLDRQARRRRFFVVNDVYVREHSFSGYWAQQIFFTDWLRFEGGLRGDFFVFDVNDRLPQQGPDPNFTSSYLNGRTTQGLVSPKANLIVTPLPDTDVYLNFGEGFHSNDARAAIANPSREGQTGSGVATAVPTPLTRALGYELGARTHQLDRLDLAAALWLLNLDSELVFSGDAGTDEPSSQASRRWGVDFEARYQITRWLFADYDLTYADPRFDNGGAIPLAPTLLMNGGLTADFGNGLSVGLRGRYLGDRPANEQRTLVARGYFLLDLIGRWRWRNVELSLQLLNLTNTDWREAQFADTSCVRSEEQSRDSSAPCYVAPGRNAATPPEGIHFTPGNPFNVIAGVKLFF